VIVLLKMQVSPQNLYILGNIDLNLHKSPFKHISGWSVSSDNHIDLRDDPFLQLGINCDYEKDIDLTESDKETDEEEDEDDEEIDNLSEKDIDIEETCISDEACFLNIETIKIQFGLSKRDEDRLRKKLVIDSKALDRCNYQCKGLSSDTRKRLRNKKASRVSRIRKKLSIYELVRRFEKSLEDREYYKSKLRELKEQLAVCK